MLKNPNFEMIVGLVSPIGVDLDKVIQYIQDAISDYNYEVHVIQVADLPNVLIEEKEPISRGLIDQLSSSMPKLREIADSQIASDDVQGDDIYAALIVNQIQKIRAADPDVTKRLYILDNLKHPQDIISLQRVYKKAFYSVGVTADIKQRILFKHPKTLAKLSIEDILADEQGLNKAATEIYDDFYFVANDDNLNKWANSISEAYQLSDYFINLGEFPKEVEQKLPSVIQRFVDLICGAPIITPTAREHNMFLAYMYSLRSADLSRQVGSTIINDSQDILALGANEVPVSGGGQYWANEQYCAHTSENELLLKEQKDQRDFVLGYDANAKIKESIFAEIVNTLKNNALITNADDIDQEVMKALKDTSLNDITEFGRVVHAEMSSLMAAARNGVSVRNAHMYCTTYPCHNCAKHIIASGIQSVEYIEPYPKSKATILHKDSIFDSDAIIDETDLTREEVIEKLVLHIVNTYFETPNNDSKVQFKPYSGIGPKKYLDLFSMKLGDGRALKRKEKDKSNVVFLKRSAELMPRVPVIV
ncbi:deaminase [Colwellia sp. MEBiC06753]